MKRILIPALLFISLSSAAQIQFWNIADIEQEQWQPFYAAQKIRTITVYQVDEKNNPLFPNMPESVKKYDAGSKIVSGKYYKYNWSNKKPELLRADSFFYNDKGMLNSYKSFEGQQMQQTGSMDFLYNIKGQQIRQNKYDFQNYAPVKSGTDMLSYSPEGRALKLVSKNTVTALDGSRNFFYNRNGKLTRVVYVPESAGINLDLIWNEKNELISYTETSGKKVSKEVTFIYDDKGRRISRHTESEGGYRDNTTYMYNSEEMLPYRTHLSYSSTGDKTDLRFEHMEFTYDQF